MAVSKSKRRNARDDDAIKKQKWPAGNVQWWNIDKIIPYEKNPRTHSEEQISQLADSIKEFGMTTALLVDEAGVLLYGHGRYRALKLLGMTEAPVMQAVGWPEAKKNAYRIADNQHALNSGWDRALLAYGLQELKSSGGDLTLTGFTLDAAEGIIATLAPPDAFRAVDEDVPTEHCCPSCGYRWSGAADAGKERGDAAVAGDQEVRQPANGAGQPGPRPGARADGAGDRRRRPRAVPPPA